MWAAGAIMAAAAWPLTGSRTPAVSTGSDAGHGHGAVYRSGDPNAACASCHQAIYERYRSTPMANASGLAADGFLPGGFTHEASGVSYRMAEQDGRVTLNFSRPYTPGLAAPADQRPLKGERELQYFVGSGKRGRTYLFEQQGYWFEIPVNWYGKKRVWDMAPNYLFVREMPLTLPVDPGCLRCHATGAQPSLPEARNRYAGAPFLEGGIACTACHGDASAHLASEGRAAMLKIGALSPVRRDSICLGCHLEGQAVVVHRGKRLVDFRPGDNLFEFASYYVRSGPTGPAERATSQWEALLESRCKQGAGDKLTCTTCHDPHGSTGQLSAAERVASYRAKCLECHDPNAAQEAAGGFAAMHHPENPDCASCHMPRAKAEDIAHEQVTDHRIRRLPGEPPRESAAGATAAGTLVEIAAGSGVAGQGNGRDLGLAYALTGARGDREAAERARQLLSQAESLPGSAADGELHQQLGFLEQLAGEKDAAAREYQLALSADPQDAVAAGNLALLKAGDHQYGAAMELWERAFQEDPVQLAAGMNLAFVQCGLGKKEAALGTLDRILAFSPDDGKARELARDIRSGLHACAAR